MKKRALVAVLWFYTFWYAGAMIASVAGISPLLGPILAIAAGVLIAVDPRHRVWNRPAVSAAFQRSSIEPV